MASQMFESKKEKSATKLAYGEEEQHDFFYYPLVVEDVVPRGIPHDCEHLLLSRNFFYKRLRAIFLISEKSYGYGGRIEQKYFTYMERIRHLSMFPWTIHPGSDFIFYWSVFCIFVLVISLIFEPFRISFQSSKFISTDNVDFIVAVGTSTTMLVDLFLTFITGIQDEVSDINILDPEVVRSQYIRVNTLLLSIYAAFPLDTILILTCPSYSSLIRVLGFFKILRGGKLFEKIRFMTNSFMVTGVKKRLLYVIILIIFCAHWFGCFHWLEADLFGTKATSWPSQLNLTSDSSLSLNYTSSFLRSLGYLYLVGPYNVPPIRVSEIVLSIENSVIGLFLWTHLICTIAVISSENYKIEFGLQEAKAYVHEYIKSKNFPDQLYEKITAYCDQKFKRIFVSEELILKNLSRNLQQQIRLLNCEKILDNAPVFKNLPIYTKYELIEKLHFELFMPGDVILEEDGAGSVMYFILEGTVKVFSSFGFLLKELQGGDYFGEISLIANSTRGATVVASTVCELYYLSKLDLRKFLSGKSKLHEQILRTAKERVEEDLLMIPYNDENYIRRNAWMSARNKDLKAVEAELINIERDALNVIVPPKKNRSQYKKPTANQILKAQETFKSGTHRQDGKTQTPKKTFQVISTSRRGQVP